MTESQKALSAYVPAYASAPVFDFALPLQVYIIDTIEREARSKVLRQIGAVAALVVGMLVCQWPVAVSTANAVPSLPVSAQQAGARSLAAPAFERLAFASSLVETRTR